MTDPKWRAVPKPARDKVGRSLQSFTAFLRSIYYPHGTASARWRAARFYHQKAHRGWLPSHPRAQCLTCDYGTRIAGALGWNEMMCVGCIAAADAVGLFAGWCNG